MSFKLLTRPKFKELVFKRDNYKCIVCKDIAVDAHHLLDRKLFRDGGYYLQNGVSLCSDCHLKAEKGVYTPNELRRLARIEYVILPDGYCKKKEYNKWGKIIERY